MSSSVSNFESSVFPVLNSNIKTPEDKHAEQQSSTPSKIFGSFASDLSEAEGHIKKPRAGKVPSVSICGATK